jgi:hypothetical protein
LSIDGISIEGIEGASIDVIPIEGKSTEDISMVGIDGMNPETPELKAESDDGGGGGSLAVEGTAACVPSDAC